MWGSISFTHTLEEFKLVKISSNFPQETRFTNKLRVSFLHCLYKVSQVLDELIENAWRVNLLMWCECSWPWSLFLVSHFYFIPAKEMGHFTYKSAHINLGHVGLLLRSLDYNATYKVSSQMQVSHVLVFSLLQHIHKCPRSFQCF